MKSTVLVGLFVGVCSNMFAADLSVGFREMDAINVGDGQSEAFSGTLTLSPEATFYKTGAGSLTVPSASIENATPYAIDVLAGKLTLSGAAGAPSATAPATAQKAAVWLDASALTEGDSVSTWNDVRGGSGRYAAVAQWLSPIAGADQVPPVVAVTNGMKGVYFGGKSGRWMAFRKAGAAAAIDRVFHIFVVHGAYSTYGSLLGDTVNSRGYGLLTATAASTQTTLEVPYLIGDRGDLDYYNYQGRFFLDGRLFDPRTTNVKRGRSLFEGDLQAQPQHFDAIYRNHFETYTTDDAKRPGGDYMCEILLFTNHLAEAERLDVERYLLNKWNLPQTEVCSVDKQPLVTANPPRGTGLVKVAEGASVEVTAAADETTAPFRFDGEGDVVKCGAGTLLIGGGADRPFSGSFTMEEGDILVHGGVMPPVTVGSGETWNSANWPATRVGTVEGDAASGVRISRTVSADGNSVKVGLGELRVGGILEGTGRLTVEEGVLHLVGKERDAVKPDTGIGADEVEVPNGSFEKPFTWADAYGRCYLLPELNSWTSDRPNDYSVQFVTASCEAWTTWSSKGYLPPEGTNALMIVYNGYGYTSVTIPRAGTYEVSYYAASRYGSPRAAKPDNFGKRSQVDVMFADHAVGSVQVNEGAFTRFRHRFTVTETEAGVAKRFGFKSLQSCSDNCMIIDDIHIRAVSEPERADVVKVPGGDFENSAYVNADGSAGKRFASVFCRCMTSPDWTLSIAADAPSQNPTNGYVAICTAGTPTLYYPNYADNFTPFYPQADGRTGSGVLGFIGNYGTATTAKAFTLPKGKWLLRGEIGANRLCCNAAAAGSEKPFTDASSGVEVKVVRAGTSVASLGTVSATRHLMESRTWPTVVEVTADEGEDILLSISQTVAKGACMVDNLEFVPVTAGEAGRNLFPNGTFETSDCVGTVAVDTKGVNYYSYADRFEYSNNSYAFGLDIVDGTRCFRLHNHVGLQESVVFPAPGLYRLTVPAHTRSDGGRYAHQELRASVVLNDGSELEIFNQPIPITQSFQEISYLFRMPEAGVHAVRINGIPIPSGNVKSGVDQADRSTMIDGIRLVKVEEGDGALAIPDVAENARLTVRDGAKLALDYDGKVVVGSLSLGGTRVSGTVSAKTHPAYLTGMGEIEVKPLGGILIIR